MHWVCTFLPYFLMSRTTTDHSPSLCKIMVICVPFLIISTFFSCTCMWDCQNNKRDAGCTSQICRTLSAESLTAWSAWQVIVAGTKQQRVLFILQSQNVAIIWDLKPLQWWNSTDMLKESATVSSFWWQKTICSEGEGIWFVQIIGTFLRVHMMMSSRRLWRECLYCLMQFVHLCCGCLLK